MTPEEIKATLPYPIASVYADLDNSDSSPQTKREALYFTGYQLMRTIALTLLGQYFTLEDLPDDTSKQKEFNKTIARVSHPYYSDWISLMNALHKHGARFRLDFFSDEFGAAMERMKKQRIDLPQQQRAYHLGKENKWQNVTWLEALQGLRNSVAHSGMGRDAACLEAVEIFRPVLDALLDAFSFLRRYELLVLRSSSEDEDEDERLVQLLRGAEISEPQTREIDDALKEAFAQSPVVMRSPENRAQSLFPFFHGHIEGEPMRYYDGHYLRDDPNPKMHRRMIYYLGGGQRFVLEDSEAFKFVQSPAASNAAERLREFLDGRNISWKIKREDIALWSLRDTTNDYARRTLEDLTGVKYLPECYLDRPDLSDWLWKQATAETIHHRAMLFTGRAGSGKTALLADLTRRLLEEEKEHLVFFVRGGDLTDEIAGRNLLIANLSHKIGLEPTEFQTFAEFFAHLAAKRKEDKLADRRFVIVIDALNEARSSMQLMREALEMVSAARTHDWLRVILSARDEFMFLWSGRRGELEANPFYSVRDLFVAPPENPERPLKPEDPPAWFVPTFTETEAKSVYQSYQTANTGGKSVSACLTQWEEIAPPTREKILLVPLNLDLWMRTFDGRQAPAISGRIELFEAYLADLRHRFDKFWASMSAILDFMLTRGRMELTDADAHEIEDAWRASVGEYERRLRFSPLETACASGVMQKRATEEGGGYRIPHQRLREVLLYLRMKDLDSRLKNETIKEWLSLPAGEEIEGALALIANDLWIAGRAAELAEFSTTDLGSEALARMLARRLVLRDEPAVLNERIEKIFDSLPTGEAAVLRLSKLLLDDLPAKVNGLPVTAGLQILWERMLARLESKQFQNSGELKRDLGFVCNKLGDVHRNNGESKRALRFYERALEIRKNLHQSEPQATCYVREMSVSLERLGDVYNSAGEGGKALKLYLESLEIREKLHRAEPERTDLAGELGISYNNLGEIHHQKKEFGKALDFYQNSLAIRERLFQAEPHRVDLARYANLSLERLGDLHLTTGDVDTALKFYSESLETREKFYQAEPQRTDLARDASISFDNLGEVYLSKKEAEKALKFYRQSLAIREKLHRAEPQRADYARYLNLSYQRIGDAYLLTGDDDEALEFYRKSLAIREELYQAQPHQADLAWDVATAYDKVAKITGGLNSEEGKAWFNRGRDILRKLKKENRVPNAETENYLEWLEENLK